VLGEDTVVERVRKGRHWDRADNEELAAVPGGRH
jgi:hypothetical protein